MRIIRAYEKDSEKNQEKTEARKLKLRESAKNSEQTDSEGE
jgi:hypothetical protein